jgi:NADPH2:quinone reductase
VPLDDAAASTLRAHAEGRGADVVFDTVDGIVFDLALSWVAPKGRLIEISATNGRRVEFDLLDFYHHESRIFGIESRRIGLVGSAGILNRLAPLFDNGSLSDA